MPDLDPVAALLTPTAINNNTHYLSAVAQLAAKQALVVHEAVHSAEGAVLLATGTQLPADIGQVFSRYTLVSPIYQHLDASDPVDMRTLEAEVMMLAASHQLGQLLVRAVGGRMPVLLEPLRYMPWPRAASFQLTLMRDQNPALLQHSLLMMMVAVFLGSKMQMPMHDLGRMAAGALLHDVGMLFLPPDLITHDRHLQAEERQLLTVHSMLAVMVVQSCAVYGVEVEDAVLEHHERLDGSGYPQGAQGAEISPMGRILMVAEVVSAFFGKYLDIPNHRLQLALRMNHVRLPSELLAHVYPMLGEQRPLAVQSRRQDAHSVVQKVLEEMARVAAVFQLWSDCCQNLPRRWQGMVGGRAGVFVEMRLLELDKTLAEAGVHPRLGVVSAQSLQTQSLPHLLEQLLVLREAQWQVRSMLNACLRRWPKVQDPETRVDWALFMWVCRCKQVLGMPLSAPMAALLKSTGVRDVNKLSGL